MISIRKYLPIIMGIALCTLSFLSATVLSRVCGLIINYTDSLPRGIYQLRPLSRADHDMIVVFPVPESVRDIVYGRGWLMKGALLMKPIAALPGESVSVTDEGLYIDKRLFGPVFVSDRQGMPLPQIRFSSLIRENQVFVASPSKRSFDSRYFGPVHVKNIVAQAVPVLTF